MDIKTVVSSLSTAIDNFKKAEFSIDSLRTLTTDVVKHVEQFSNDNFKGKDKKEAALNLLDQIYNISGVNIPFVPDSLEHKILRLAAGTIIDQVVAQLNKMGW